MNFQFAGCIHKNSSLRSAASYSSLLDTESFRPELKDPDLN
jgi:hypothetical protein